MKKVLTLCLALSLGAGLMIAQETKQETPKTEKKCCKKKGDKKECSTKEKECSAKEKECSTKEKKSCCKAEKKSAQ